MDDWKKRKEQREKDNAAYLVMSPQEKINYNIQGIKKELDKINVSYIQLNDPNFSKNDLRSFLNNLKLRIDCGQGRSHCIECALSEIDNAREKF